MSKSGVVIVGGGQGGYQAAASLRTEGYQEPITIVGEEAELPYQRPPLSKGMLTGKQESRHATLRPAAFYETQNIGLITGQRVSAIDPGAHAIALADGRSLSYDSLILATGARNRLLPIPGAHLDGVCYLRTVDESLQVKNRVAEAQSVVIVGGGFIGLEVAAAARTLGKPVTVIEAASRLMARVVAPVVSEYFRQTHRAQGAAILFNVGVSELRGTYGIEEVILTDGSRIAADLVVVGIGVIPNDELAIGAGLAVKNGIAVDQHLRTAHHNIFAIGDCACYPNVFCDAHVRLESVQNAVDHALNVAKAITGNAQPYASAPWFWTDQFDIKMQMAGIAASFDSVVTRGDPETRKFSVFYYQAGQLRAVDSINRAAEHLIARKLIAAKANITPDEAADESFDLKSRI